MRLQCSFILVLIHPIIKNGEKRGKRCVNILCLKAAPLGRKQIYTWFERPSLTSARCSVFSAYSWKPSLQSPELLKNSNRHDFSCDGLVKIQSTSSLGPTHTRICFGQVENGIISKLRYLQAAGCCRTQPCFRLQREAQVVTSPLSRRISAVVHVNKTQERTAFPGPRSSDSRVS